MGSRVPGYAGHRQAFEYVKRHFEQIGLENIRVEEHAVTVPIDKGASLTLMETGEKIEIYGFWPNHVQTPSIPGDGISGG